MVILYISILATAKFFVQMSYFIYIIHFSLIIYIHNGMVCIENDVQKGGVLLIITKETDYALRILRALSEEEKHTIPYISEHEMIPVPFAYKILRKLDRAVFVFVTKGPGGGCQLRENLDRVSLYDLMQAIGEKGVLSTCMDPAYSCPWREKYGICNVHCRLAELQETMVRELKGLNLKQLISGCCLP